MSNNVNPNESELEWIRMREEIGLGPAEALRHQETAKEKFKRKFLENPFVPVGCGLTAIALTYGLYNMQKGNTKMSQVMMRSRIAAQGFTVVALLGGVVFAAKNTVK